MANVRELAKIIVSRPRPARTAVASIVIIIAASVPALVSAQEIEPAGPAAAESQDDGVWVAAGVTGDVSPRWRGTLVGGYLGGLDTRFLLASATLVAHPDVSLTAGYIYARTPSRIRGPSLHILRAGGLWTALRTPLEIDNQLLVEHLSSDAFAAFVRVRDRVRVTWRMPDTRAHLRLFASGEAFLRSAPIRVSGHRYQAGLGRTFGRADIDVFWLRRLVSDRKEVDALVVQFMWHVRRL